MICVHQDPYKAPELLPPCPICARLEREGRALADLLDEPTIDPKIRAELLSAKSAGSWSAEARAVVAMAGMR